MIICQYTFCLCSTTISLLERFLLLLAGEDLQREQYLFYQKLSLEFHFFAAQKDDGQSHKCRYRKEVRLFQLPVNQIGTLRLYMAKQIILKQAISLNSESTFALYILRE